MVAAPVVGFMAIAIAPDERSNGAEQLETIADSPARFGFGVLLSLVSLALLVLAVIGLVRLLGAEASRYGSAGGTLALFGIVAAAALTGIHWVDYHLAKFPGRVVAIDLETRITSGGAFVLLSVIALATSLGLIVLAAGLFRRRVVAAWAPLALAVGAALVPIGHLAAEGGAGKAIQLVGYAALVAGFGAVAQVAVRGIADHGST